MLHSDIFYAFLITAVSLTVVATILSRARIPTIVGFVLTGILIGPSGLNWIKSLPAAHTISELGIIFLMFSLGLEVSLEHLRKMFRSLITLGFTQVAGTMALGMLFFYLAFDFSLSKSFVFGACLALSSTAVVLKLLQEKRETETPHGRVSITVLLFQDIAALPLMVTLPLLATDINSSSPEGSLGVTLLWIALFLFGCFFVGYYIIPKLFSEVVRTGSREVFFFLILSLTFIISFFAERVGLSMSLGAFVAGVIVSESPYNKQALAEMSPLRDIFLGFFFASVGMMVNLEFIYQHIFSLLWLIPILFVLKFTLIYFIVRRNSHSHGISFSSALALTQIGEFSFILAASALSFNLISELEFQYFLALAVSSLLFTPLMFSFAIRSSAHNSWPELARTLSLSFSRKLGSPVPDANDLAESERAKVLTLSGVAPRKTIVIGLGLAGIKALEELTRKGVPCLGIDFNMNHVFTVQHAGMEAQYGDATRPEVLEAAGIREAFLVLITVSGKHLTSQILAVVHHLCPRVKVIVRVQYLLDLQGLNHLSKDEVVVAEVETSKTLVHRILAHYDMGPGPSTV